MLSHGWEALCVSLKVCFSSNVICKFQGGGFFFLTTTYGLELLFVCLFLETILTKFQEVALRLSHLFVGSWLEKEAFVLLVSDMWMVLGNVSKKKKKRNIERKRTVENKAFPFPTENSKKNPNHAEIWVLERGRRASRFLQFRRRVSANLGQERLSESHQRILVTYTTCDFRILA